MDGADVVVNGVGAVDEIVAAAVQVGAIYIDTVRDRAFVQEVAERYRYARTPIVAGCPPEAVTGDMAAALAAENVGGVCHRLDVHHDLGGWTGVGAPSGVETRHVWFPHGVRETVPVPWLEQVHVPRHVPGVPVTVTATPEGTGRAVLSTLAVAVAADGERCLAAIVADDIELLGARMLAGLAELVEGEGPMAPAEAVAPERFLDHVRDTGEPRALEWAISTPSGWFTPLTDPDIGGA